MYKPALLQFVFFLHLAAAEVCMYEYTSHPMMDLSCDPYGATLQLHCAVTGPISPQFHLQWYLSKPDNSTATELDSEIVLNVVQDGINSISSILSIGPISAIHTGHCIKCQVEFDEMEISLTRDEYKLCIGSAVSYTSLPSCGDEIVVFNSTSFCATAQDFDFSSLQQEDEGSAVPPTPLVNTPFPTAHSTSQPMATTESEVRTPHDTTASSDVLDLTSSTSNMPNSTAPNSQSAVEGGLFVAIAICIVFIVIIIILMYFVVRLFREWKWKREKEHESAEDQSSRVSIEPTLLCEACTCEHVYDEPMFNPPDDGGPSSTTPANPTAILAHGYSVERFHLDAESVFLSTLDVDVDEVMTTRSLQDLTRIKAVPPVPPRSWKNKMVKANSAYALNFRGLSRGYNNFTFPEDRVDGGQEDPSNPPPIPLRSKSREHFYHTLQCEDSGALSSPPYSHHRSNSNAEYPEEEPRQLELLFDDPRYVALQVEGSKDGDLRGRKDIWHSTPSLASTRLMTGRGARDRRSLRLTHVVGTEIYN